MALKKLRNYKVIIKHPWDLTSQEYRTLSNATMRRRGNMQGDLRWMYDPSCTTKARHTYGTLIVKDAYSIAVYTAKGKLVGHALLDVQDSVKAPSKKKKAFIQFYVKAEYRRLGVATLLLACGRKLVKHNNWDLIEMQPWDDRSESFYKNRFVEVGKRNWKYRNLV